MPHAPGTAGPARPGLQPLFLSSPLCLTDAIPVRKGNDALRRRLSAALVDLMQARAWLQRGVWQAEERPAAVPPFADEPSWHSFKGCCDSYILP